jgi:hypothetical protein
LEAKLEVEKEWLGRREIVARAVEGYTDTEKLVAARDFFLDRTGIEIDLDTLPSGDQIAGLNAHDDLQKIQLWYADNHHQLIEDYPSRARRTDCDEERIRAEQAQEIWMSHESAVELALDGQQRDDDFVEAVRFFSDVTGIEIDVEIFSLGYLPGPHAKEDLTKIQAWYEQNADRLYFDEDWLNVRVQLEPNAPS